MEPGEARSDRRPSAALLWGLFLVLLTGCAGRKPFLDRALLAERGTATRNEGVAEAYRVGCGDVLELTVPARPDLSGRRDVEPDGRIDLGKFGRPRVEALTVEEVVLRIAEQTSVPAPRVQVRVEEFRSQQIYLIGQVVGAQRAVPYRGQETVLDLLKRVGGVTAGAAPEHVYVVRSRVAEGGRPEVFHIDLQAAVLGKDQQSNVRLQPFDQVFIGERRRSRLEKCFPPWLRPTYEALCGLRRTPSSRPPQPGPSSSLVRQPPDTAPVFRGTGR